MTHHIDAVQTDENLVVKKMGLFAVSICDKELPFRKDADGCLQ